MKKENNRENKNEIFWFSTNFSPIMLNVKLKKKIKKCYLCFRESFFQFVAGTTTFFQVILQQGLMWLYMKESNANCIKFEGILYLAMQQAFGNLNINFTRLQSSYMPLKSTYIFVHIRVFSRIIE